MKIRNGYLLLITSMTACQVIYDINFIQGVIPGYVNCIIWNVFNVFGGLSVSLWSNLISFVTVFVIVEIRSLNILQNYFYFSLLATGFPLVLACVTISVLHHPSSNDDDLSDDNEPYLYCAYNNSDLSHALYGINYWGRLLSICFNFLVFIYINYRIRKMMKLIRTDPVLLHLSVKEGVDVGGAGSGVGVGSVADSVKRGSGRNEPVSLSMPANASAQSLAIIALVSRMKWYPLAQAISRSGAAWNEFDNYHYATYPSNLMAAICSPMCGILNFAIFLVMQPKAWKSLTDLLSFYCKKAINVTAGGGGNSGTDRNRNNTNGMDGSGQGVVVNNVLHEIMRKDRLDSVNDTRLEDFSENDLHDYINDFSRRTTTVFGNISPEI
eukprot:gene11215-12507_t